MTIAEYFYYFNYKSSIITSNVRQIISVPEFTFIGIIPFFIGKFRPKVLFATTQCFSTLSMLVFAAYNHFREYRQDLITRFFQDPNFLVDYRIHQILSFMNSVTTNLSTNMNSFILFIFDNYVPQWWIELDDELNWLFTNKLSATR